MYLQYPGYVEPIQGQEPGPEQWQSQLPQRVRRAVAVLGLVVFAVPAPDPLPPIFECLGSNPARARAAQPSLTVFAPIPVEPASPVFECLGPNPSRARVQQPGLTAFVPVPISPLLPVFECLGGNPSRRPSRTYQTTFGPIFVVTANVTVIDVSLVPVGGCGEPACDLPLAFGPALDHGLFIIEGECSGLAFGPPLDSGLRIGSSNHG